MDVGFYETRLTLLDGGQEQLPVEEIVDEDIDMAIEKEIFDELDVIAETSDDLTMKGVRSLDREDR
ncbi:hypothetical protein PsorP6_017548 [Peronosclerospora sorghi]|uniref:Uncharacterized protein n=1 Tax=Peronosclerospora sorghi TaxID=230839 RepID=A0ACC0WLD2_9STRA|nr:hypothetical protein PsorP6_017548 [Peronosclerospora sorghi]